MLVEVMLAQFVPQIVNEGMLHQHQELKKHHPQLTLTLIVEAINLNSPPTAVIHGKTS